MVVRPQYVLGHELRARLTSKEPNPKTMFEKVREVDLAACFVVQSQTRASFIIETSRPVWKDQSRILRIVHFFGLQYWT